LNQARLPLPKELRKVSLPDILYITQVRARRCRRTAWRLASLLTAHHQQHPQQRQQRRNGWFGFIAVP
jgi:hypothetical protein